MGFLGWLVHGGGHFAENQVPSEVASVDRRHGDFKQARNSMEPVYLPPIREVPDEVETLKLDQVEVKSYVGGLVKSFERKAA